MTMYHRKSKPTSDYLFTTPISALYVVTLYAKQKPIKLMGFQEKRGERWGAGYDFIRSILKVKGECVYNKV